MPSERHIYRSRGEWCDLLGPLPSLSHEKADRWPPSREGNDLPHEKPITAQLPRFLRRNCASQQVAARKSLLGNSLPEDERKRIPLVSGLLLSSCGVSRPETK